VAWIIDGAICRAKVSMIAAGSLIRCRCSGKIESAAFLLITVMQIGHLNARHTRNLRLASFGSCCPID
jgi:hypothetical protein